MNLNQATKHGIRALLVLAHRGRPLTGHQLHHELQIGHAVLQNVMNKLAHAGIVESKRGTGGGFCLAKPAARISLYDIVTALQPFRAEKPPWYKILAVVMKALDGISLEEVGK